MSVTSRLQRAFSLITFRLPHGRPRGPTWQGSHYLLGFSGSPSVSTLITTFPPQMPPRLRGRRPIRTKHGLRKETTPGAPRIPPWAYFHVTCLRACRRHSLRCWKRGLCAGRRVLQHRGREALQDEKPSAKAAGCSGVVLEFVSDWLLQLHGWRRDVLRAGRPGTQPLGFHTNGTGWVPAPKLHTC